jgi:SAM-dependent methyltransferase
MISGLKECAKLVIPTRAWKSLRANFLPRRCPVCENGLDCFLPYGLVRREEAMCPYCQSLERHRLMWLFLKERTDLFDGRPKRLLHVAPEPTLGKLFQGIPGVDYLSSDYAPGRAMVQMDITDIDMPDGSFDVVICNHVLEHVSDDRRAMAEFVRVLRPGGWAILQVPITTNPVTYEDPSITAADEREKAFGQWDHVRLYGQDYVDRLRSSGFVVKADSYVQDMPQSRRVRFGLDSRETVYFCRKP